MTSLAFNGIIDSLADYFGQTVSDVTRQVLWNTIQYWSDDEIKSVQKSIENEEKSGKNFSKLFVWSKYRDRYLSSNAVKTSPDQNQARTQFYHVNDCPLCGYGSAVRWEKRFDRFTEFVHRVCPMPSMKDRSQFLVDYKPPAAVDIYPVSSRDELFPVNGNAARSDDGRMRRIAQATESIKYEPSAPDLPF